MRLSRWLRHLACRDGATQWFRGGLRIAGPAARRYRVESSGRQAGRDKFLWREVGEQVRIQYRYFLLDINEELGTNVLRIVTSSHQYDLFCKGRHIVLLSDLDWTRK